MGEWERGGGLGGGGVGQGERGVEDGEMIMEGGGGWGGHKENWGGDLGKGGRREEAMEGRGEGGH